MQPLCIVQGVRVNALNDRRTLIPSPSEVKRPSPSIYSIIDTRSVDIHMRNKAMAWLLSLEIHCEAASAHHSVVTFSRELGNRRWLPSHAPFTLRLWGTS